MKPVEIEYLIKNGTKATLEQIMTDLTKVGQDGATSINATTAAFEESQQQVLVLTELVGRLENEIKRLNSTPTDIDQTKNIEQIEVLQSKVEELKLHIKQLEEVSETTQVVPSSLPTAKRQFDGLHMSIQQMAREMPTLAMGPQMFFLAISNNLPIFTDELARAKKEYAALSAAGEKGTPVWKQVTKSLLSWQTAMTTGIMLLVMYGGKVVDFFKNLATGNKEITQSALALEDFRTKVAETTADSLTKYNALQRGWENLGDSMEAKRAFIEKNKKAFEELGVSVGDVADAEEVLVTRADDFIQMLKSKSMAMASLELAKEKNKEALLKELEADNLEKSKPLVDETATTINPYGVYTYKTGNKIENPLIAKKREEAEELREIAIDFISQSEKFKEAEANFDVNTNNDTGTLDRVKERELESEILAQIQKAEDQEYELKKLRAANNLEVIRIERDAQIAAITEARDAYVESYSSTHNVSKEEVDVSAFDREMEAVNAIALKKEREYINYQTKLETERYNRIKVKYADTQEQKELIRKEYASKIALAEKKEDSDLVARLKEAMEIELAGSRRKINSLLEQYQSFDQKRKGIDEKYAEDKTALETELKRLQDTGEDTTDVEASLEARETAYKNSIKSLESEIIQSTEFYNKLFSSFSDKGYTVLKDFYKEAKNVIEGAVVSGDSVMVAIPELAEDGSIVEKQVKITVAEYQKMVGQLEAMGDELERDNPFKAVYNSFSDMLKAIKEGDTDAFSNSMESLQSAVDSTVGTMTEWGDSLETIFGDTVGQAFDEIVQLTEGVLDFGIGIGQIASGDIIGGITSVLSGVASVVECLTSWRDKEEEQQRSWYLAELEINRLLEERNYELAESRNTIADVLADTEALAWLVKNGFATENSSSQWASTSEALSVAMETYESLSSDYETLQNKMLNSNAEWTTQGSSLTWTSYSESLSKYSDLSGDALKAQMALLYEQDKLSDSARDYYESWIETGGEIEDLVDTIDELYASMREMVMGVSFDSWLSNAASALQSMQSDISALGDFTEETLTDALLNAFMYQRLAETLEPLYNELSDALIDGSADADFISDWKEQFEEIMSDASDEYAAFADAMGISSSTTQSGNSGSFETMTQDQGTKLEGLFTAAEIHLDSIDDNVAQMKDDIEEVSIQMSNATGYLKTIAENTTESKDTLADLYTTFKKMISDGLKVK